MANITDSSDIDMTRVKPSKKRKVEQKAPAEDQSPKKKHRRDIEDIFASIIPAATAWQQVCESNHEEDLKRAHAARTNFVTIVEQNSRRNPPVSQETFFLGNKPTVEDIGFNAEDVRLPLYTDELRELFIAALRKEKYKVTVEAPWENQGGYMIHPVKVSWNMAENISPE